MRTAVASGLISGPSGGLLDRERIIATAGFNRWLVPPAALAIHLCIGMAYGFSVFCVRAHQHAAGARRAGAIGGEGEALGRSQGGFSTKLHLRAEGSGKPIAAVLTAASGTSRSRWRRCWTRARSGARAAADPACGRAGWPATRATAARPREGGSGAAASGQ